VHNKIKVEGKENLLQICRAGG